MALFGLNNVNFISEILGHLSFYKQPGIVH